MSVKTMDGRCEVLRASIRHYREHTLVLEEGPELAGVEVIEQTETDLRASLDLVERLYSGLTKARLSVRDRAHLIVQAEQFLVLAGRAPVTGDGQAVASINLCE